jgi:hypothetical protein
METSTVGIKTAGASAGLFTLANRTPFNIALERAGTLATDIFGSGKWTIQPCGGRFSGSITTEGIVHSPQRDGDSHIPPRPAPRLRCIRRGRWLHYVPIPALRKDGSLNRRYS